jgi:hypothetical protein
MNQLKLLNWQEKIFQQHVKEMKEHREKLKTEFYQLKYKFDYDTMRFNSELFKYAVKDRGKREEYYQARKSLWEKRRNKEDSSEELATLKALDLEAGEIIARETAKAQERQIKQE